ncbi:MAG TPA: type II toxin-antitoxin system prevent-host-death family antitoxin [Thermoanaerobaculia bacterium]|nr:type II toxin-antitoxin system prevent-host-death family antitoxin [Thermoanaerobaculia bacterium]
MIVDAHDAEKQIVQLLAKVARGEEVIITRDGEPIATMIPWPPRAEQREDRADADTSR